MKFLFSTRLWETVLIVKHRKRTVFIVHIIKLNISTVLIFFIVNKNFQTCQVLSQIFTFIKHEKITRRYILKNFLNIITINFMEHQLFILKNNLTLYFFRGRQTAAREHVFISNWMWPAKKIGPRADKCGTTNKKYNLSFFFNKNAVIEFLSFKIPG